MEEENKVMSKEDVENHPWFSGGFDFRRCDVTKPIRYISKEEDEQLRKAIKSFNKKQEMEKENMSKAQIKLEQTREKKELKRLDKLLKDFINKCDSNNRFKNLEKRQSFFEFEEKIKYGI